MILTPRRLHLAVLVGVLSLVLGAASPALACAKSAHERAPCCPAKASKGEMPCPGAEHSAPMSGTALCCAVSAVPMARTANVESPAPLLLAATPAPVAVLDAPAPASPPLPPRELPPGPSARRTVLFGSFLI